jgi:hypothetical protein
LKQKLKIQNIYYIIFLKVMNKTFYNSNLDINERISVS